MGDKAFEKLEMIVKEYRKEREEIAINGATIWNVLIMIYDPLLLCFSDFVTILTKVHAYLLRGMLIAM